MATNKVMYGDETLIDLTGDNVTAADVAQGVRFHLPSGVQSVGTATGGGEVETVSGSCRLIGSNSDSHLSILAYTNANDELVIERLSGEYEYITTLTVKKGTIIVYIGNSTYCSELYDLSNCKGITMSQYGSYDPNVENVIGDTNCYGGAGFIYDIQDNFYFRATD